MKHNETFTYLGVKFQFKKQLSCNECCFASKDEDNDIFCQCPTNLRDCYGGGFIQLPK